MVSVKQLKNKKKYMYKIGFSTCVNCYFYVSFRCFYFFFQNQSIKVVIYLDLFLFLLKWLKHVVG